MKEVTSLFKDMSSLVVFIFFLSACNNELEIIESIEEPYMDVQVSETAEATFDDFASSYEGLRTNGDLISFDLKNLKAAKEKESGIITSYALANSNDGFMYAIGFFESKNGISKNPLIVRSTLPINGISNIEYFLLDGTKLASFKMNQYDNSIEIDYKLGKTSSRMECVTGDEMMACIEDVYTGHGWWSVGAWVVTAFAPEAALIAVGGCGLYECNN